MFSNVAGHAVPRSIRPLRLALGAALALTAGCAEDAPEPAIIELTVDLSVTPFTLSWEGGPVDHVEMSRCEQDCQECKSGFAPHGISTVRWQVDTSHLEDPAAGITSPLVHGEPIGEYPEAFGPLESGRIYSIVVHRGGPLAGENEDAEAVGCIVFEAP